MSSVQRKLINFRTIFGHVHTFLGEFLGALVVLNVCRCEKPRVFSLAFSVRYHEGHLLLEELEAGAVFAACVAIRALLFCCRARVCALNYSLSSSSMFIRLTKYCICA